MSTGIDFVLYLGPAGNGPSDQCRRLYAQLSDNSRARIKTMDYNEIVQTLGPKKPAWLRGYPTLSSYESPPRVQEGSAVINTLSEWVRQQQQASNKPAAAPARVAAEEIGTVNQSTSDGSGAGFGNYASVVNQDLYYSQMASKNAPAATTSTSRGGTTRVSSADIEAYYNRMRK